MSFIAAALIGGGAAILGGVIGAHGAQSAANTQASAANSATAAQLQMYDQTRTDLAPWRQAGANALGAIGSNADFFNHQFGPADLTANLAPNYKFMLDQGLGATTNMANAMGGLGGNSLKAVNDYAQNYAQNAYQQAYTNYTANQTNIFNRLSAIAGLGQTAGSNQSTGGSAYASGIANSTIGAGNARAAGIVGTSNAISGGVNGAAGWYSLANMAGGGGGAGPQSYIPYVPSTDTSGWNVGLPGG